MSVRRECPPMSSLGVGAGEPEGQDPTAVDIIPTPPRTLSAGGCQCCRTARTKP